MSIPKVLIKEGRDKLRLRAAIQVTCDPIILLTKPTMSLFEVTGTG